MTDGVATNQTIMLPAAVLGPTTLWIDDGAGDRAEYVHGKVAGTSPTLWFRDPFIRDLQTPRDEMALDALTSTPLAGQAGRPCSASRYGAPGRLVVTRVFAQGYTVSDVQCADETGRAAVHGGGVRPRDGVHVLARRATQDGHARSRRARRSTASPAGVTEFNGLTEIGFPHTFTPASRTTTATASTTLRRARDAGAGAARAGVVRRAVEPDRA